MKELRTGTLSVNWTVAIPANMTPFELGQHDARNGAPCDPDAYFGKGNDYDHCHVKYDRGDYVHGWIKAKGL